jgi:sugar phosphate isomerase/epimerase
MELIIFTKHFKPLSLKNLMEAIKSAGGDGADLCVREGYPVNPGNVTTKLKETVEIFKNQGLSIPMITTPGDFTDPDNPATEKMLEGCRNAGVTLVKLGYWKMDSKEYWDRVEEIRKMLEKYSALGEKHNVKLLIHNHSYSTMGLNACSVMNLVEGFNPRYIGVFADPGHLSIVGEPLPMALSIMKKYLSAVAVKDVVRENFTEEGKKTWKIKMVQLGEGNVDWHTLVKLLQEMKFSGPVSIHSEYAGIDTDTLVDKTRIDIRFFRKIIEETLKAG